MMWEVYHEVYAWQCSDVGFCLSHYSKESAGRCVLGEMASYALYPFDLFRSYEKIEKLAPVPVFVMHGINDKVVPCASGKALYTSLMKERARLRLLEKDVSGKGDSDGENLLTYAPKWIPDVGHNDMPEFDCLNDVAKFLHFLEQQQLHLERWNATLCKETLIFVYYQRELSRYHLNSAMQ